MPDPQSDPQPNPQPSAENNTPADERPQRERRRARKSTKARSGYHHRNRAVQIPDGHMAVGRIVGIHGLGGELRVEPHTDYPERFAADETIWVGTALAPHTITRAREHKGMILLTLDQVTEREQAETLRDEWLFIPDSEAATLPEGEYYVHDIVGLSVVDEAGTLIGRVTDVLQTGANDVYIIATEGHINRGKELLIPAIADVVQQVDIPAATMTIRLIPGLIDE